MQKLKDKCTSNKKKFPEKELSQEVIKRVTEIFKLLDKDGCGLLNPSEAINYWDNNFGKLAAKELFK